MSRQECEIAQCSPNQLEMMTNSPALASQQCPVPLIQDNCLDFLWATPEIASDTRLKSIGTPFSGQEREESFTHPVSSQEES